MKTRESVIFDLHYLVRKAMTYPRGKRKIAVEAEVLQDIIDDLMSAVDDKVRICELENEVHNLESECESLRDDISEMSYS